MTQRTWPCAARLRMPLVLVLLLMPWALPACSLLQRQISPRWIEGEVKSNSEGVLFDVIHVSPAEGRLPSGCRGRPWRTPGGFWLVSLWGSIQGQGLPAAGHSGIQSRPDRLDDGAVLRSRSYPARDQRQFPAA